MHDVVVLTGDDWEALFVDGVLLDQGGRISLQDIARHCPIASLRQEHMDDNVHDRLQQIGQFDTGISLADAKALKPAVYDEDEIGWDG